MDGSISGEGMSRQGNKKCMEYPIALNTLIAYSNNCAFRSDDGGRNARILKGGYRGAH